MVVTPLIFSTLGDIHWQANDEVAEVLWVPISLFADSSNRQTMSWQANGQTLQLPCYYYQQQCIWGLSLMMIDEFMQAYERHGD